MRAFAVSIGALILLGLAAGGGFAAGEPDPTIEQTRRGRLRDYPPPDTTDFVLIREGTRLYQSGEIEGWIGIRKVFPAPTLLLTEGHQYLMGHPAPPDSFFLVYRAASFFMHVYGLPFAGPCPESTTRPVFGAPTIVKSSRSCTSESATDWIFDYVRGQFRLYLYHNREPMKVFDLNLPRPDPEDKWKNDFPFGWTDAEVIGAVRGLGQVADQAFHERDRSARKKLLTDVLAARQHVKEVLDAQDGPYSHDDYFRYTMWSEGVAYFAAYEALSTMRGAPVAVSKVDGYVPYLVYTRDALEPSLRRFRTVTSEPLTRDDLMILGALLTGTIKELDREWRLRIILRETWIEDLLERAARQPD